MTQMIDEVGPVIEAGLQAYEQRVRASPPIEKAALFADMMVRALLDGSKTQTRRVVRNIVNVALERCPLGTVGGRIWVREAWCSPDPSHPHDVLYRADVDESVLDAERDLRRECGPGSYVPWRPSIHMPRWACRIVLEITRVQLQHLWEITDEDIAAEGVQPQVGAVSVNGAPPATGFVSARWRFQALWNANHHGRVGCTWRDNPLVWVVSFRRVQP